MAIHRVTVQWSGFAGAPGYSNFFFSGDGGGDAAQDARLRVIAFFEEIRPVLPEDVRYTVPNEVAVIDEQTGMVDSFLNVGTPGGATGTGTGSGPYSAASGAVVTWNTNGVRNGRRVRGRTFVVPLIGSAYQSDGTLGTTALQDLNDAAAEMVGTGFDSGFGVWSRPRNGDGAFYEVTGHRVVDKVAVLRSRRD